MLRYFTQNKMLGTVVVESNVDVKVANDSIFRDYRMQLTIRTLFQAMLKEYVKNDKKLVSSACRRDNCALEANVQECTIIEFS